MEKTSQPHTDPVRIEIQLPGDVPSAPTDQQSLACLQCLPLVDATILTWPALNTPGLLVLASGYDMRQPCILELSDPSSNWQTQIDAGYASIGQRFHIEIPTGIGQLQVTTDYPEGSEPQPLWVITDNDRMPNSVPSIWPMIDQVDRLSRFFDRLAEDCIAEFGWMGGCITEAYEALAELETIERWYGAHQRWLDNFLDDDHLYYQDLRGRPRVDSFVIIETTLPIAGIARTRPKHPIIDISINYLRNSREPSATCEGCYTVAYPLAQIGVLRQQPDLLDMAYNELAHRRDKLFHRGDIYLRHRDENRTFRNWARGVAWYLLGFAKCLELTGCDGRWAEMADHLAERCGWALGFQREDGLWDNFFDEPGAPPDTSGSAGIATAMVHAQQLGLLGEEVGEAARRCWAGMQPWLMVDGWLGGVAPSNKRGEEAQHGQRRVSETFGMGLMGQLAAAVGVLSA